MSISNRKVFFIYLGIFLLVFLKYPLQNALTGDTDTLLFVSTFMQQDLLMKGAPSMVLFPSEQGQAYSESALALGFLFDLFWGFVFNVPMSWYLMLSISMAFTAFGLYRLVYLLSKDRMAAFAAGCFFTLSGFTFGNIDTFNVAIWGFGFFGIYYWIKLLRTERWRFVLFAGICFGLQLFCSAYAFAMVGLIVLLLLIGHQEFRKWRSLQLTLYALPIVLGAIALFFSYHSQLFSGNPPYNPLDDPVKVAISSLHLEDLFRVGEGNLIYKHLPVLVSDVGIRAKELAEAYGIYPSASPFQQADVSIGQNDQLGILADRRSAGLGLLLYLLALVGIWKAKREALPWLILGAVGLILSFGFSLNLFGLEIPMPGYLLHKWGWDSPFRIPSRFFYIVLFCLSILAAYGLRYLLAGRSTTKYKFATLFAVLFVFGLENIPFLKKTYAYTPIPYEDTEVIPYYSMVLYLPTTIDMTGVKQANNSNSRECYYTIDAMRHSNQTVNGIAGYYPEMTVRIREIISKLPDREAISSLKYLGVTHIVYRKQEADANNKLLEGIITSRAYDARYESGNSIIFEL